MIKYKLIDKNGCTRSGQSNKTYWLDGQWKEAVGQGTTLSTSDVIHWYSNPKLALIFNPIHANIANPRMIEIEIDEIVAHDGLKGGSKKARFVREIPVPEITLIQKVEFAIRISLTYYREKTYVTWAENWLSGKDRSAEAAKTAMRDAKTAWRAVTRAAVSAARAAAWAAEAATWDSVRAAAWVAIRTAEAAAWAAEAAKTAWRIAEDAVRAAAWASEADTWASEADTWDSEADTWDTKDFTKAAARASAWASEAAASASADDGLFIKIIEEITENKL